ncbi:MAG TPA: hypothetical protein VMT35_15135 [Ignavibacteriaceae bacterium]|nr:hypothetical protein [Ignavibacteriaceae bacterium]
MKNKLFVIVSILLLNNSASFPWGAEGHKLITKKAIENLPPELKELKRWEEIFIDRSNDADKRKESDKSEGPKHFIDIDYYREFQDGRMIEDKDKLVKIYGDNTVIKTGILPWATFETYEKLIKAFMEKNKENMLTYISDLAHYVEDGHQPMHTLVNYDGQLSGQKGVHYRYESEMVDMHLDELSNSFDSCGTKIITNPLDFIFDYITEANSYSDLLFSADNFAFKQCGSREGSEYYRLLWFKTKYITEAQFRNAGRDLVSLIYSAWIKAGRPDVAAVN